MTTIKVKLRPSSVTGRAGSIVYLVTRNRLTRQITTSYRLLPHEWDSSNSTIFPTADNRLRIIDNHIQHDIERLEGVIKGLKRKRHDYTAVDVCTEYQRLCASNSFFDFMGNTISRLRQLNHFGTAKNYYAALERLKKFRKGEDILFDEVDHILMEDYEAHLRSKGLSPNTISFYMRILRAVYNRAVEQGLTKDKRPFRTVFTGMEKTRKRAISLNEIKRIRDLELSAYPYLEFVRGIFLFLFYCRGMSLIDAAYLKKTDIRDGVLSYRRHKTNQPLHIKLEREMDRIINQYSPVESPYLLPIINEFNDGRAQYYAAIHRINKALKKIGKMAGLHIPLTTYVSRHTWATIAKHKNIPISVISEALGHDSETTTQIYLSSIEPAVIDHANSLIIDSL